MYKFSCILEINSNNLYCRLNVLEYEKDITLGYHIGLHESKKIINRMC